MIFIPRFASSRRRGNRPLRAIAALVIAAVAIVNCRRGDRDQEPLKAPPPSQLVEGVALAIVYDTSGSMKESVGDSNGGTSPKYVIGNRALAQTIEQLTAWVHSGTEDLPHRLECCLVRFSGSDAAVSVPMGPYDPEPLRAWAAGFHSPDGATPLGRAMEKAGREVLRSKMLHKHVLVITDGENTAGPDPGEAFGELQTLAQTAGAGIAAHFIAFDVNAGAFSEVKRRGATVVSAANETELGAHLHAIVEKEILLEVEDPPVAPGKR